MSLRFAKFCIIVERLRSTLPLNEVFPLSLMVTTLFRSNILSFRWTMMSELLRGFFVDSFSLSAGGMISVAVISTLLDFLLIVAVMLYSPFSGVEDNESQ